MNLIIFVRYEFRISANVRIPTVFAQKSANSASKLEMEELSATVAECQRNLEAAVTEKKALLEKQVLIHDIQGVFDRRYIA